MTVNPYLGTDTLEPYLDRCREHGRGLFVLVKTSNPGSGDLQDRSVDGAPVYEAVARLLTSSCEGLRGPDTGWSSLGVVVGANHPEQAERVREALPDALFLVPGYGAQGATARQAVTGFRSGPRGAEGGVVSSSRGILFPDAPGSGWEVAFDSCLDAAIDELGEAVRQPT